MSQYRVFDILLPQATPFEVKLRLFNPNKKKQILTVLNDESYLLLNKDIALREIVRNYTQAIITGPFLFRLASANFYTHIGAKLYNSISKKIPFVLRFFLYCLFYSMEWCILFLRVVFSSVFKVFFSNSIQLSLVDPNLFAFDLLNLAQDDNKSVMIISDYEESDKVTLDLIKRLYPRLDIKNWERSFRSLQLVNTAKKDTEENFYANNPRYWELRNYIIQNPTNIMLFTTQEVLNANKFLNSIKKEEEVSFDVASVYNSFDSNKKERSKSKLSFFKKLSFINQVVIDNFIQEMENTENYSYTVKLELTTQNDKLIKSIHGEYERKLVKNETLNQVIKEMLLSVSDDITSFMLVSKPSVIKHSRILSNFKSLAKFDLLFTKEVEYTAQLQFNGDKESIKEGWVVI
jgi:hypothetical protein